MVLIEEEKKRFGEKDRAQPIDKMKKFNEGGWLMIHEKWLPAWYAIKKKKLCTKKQIGEHRDKVDTCIDRDKGRSVTMLWGFEAASATALVVDGGGGGVTYVFLLGFG